MEKEKHLFMTTYSKANGETLHGAEKCYNLCSAMIVASGRLALDLKKFDYEKVEVYEESKFKLLKQAPVMLSLPSVDDAGVIAVNVASNVRPKLTAQEEAMFIAGFQECVKYLSGQGKGNGT